MAKHEFDDYLDAAAALVGLPIAADYRPGVLLNLERLAAMAALVEGAPLDQEAEPAPIYRP